MVARLENARSEAMEAALLPLVAGDAPTAAAVLQAPPSSAVEQQPPLSEPQQSPSSAAEQQEQPPLPSAEQQQLPPSSEQQSLPPSSATVQQLHPLAAEHQQPQPSSPDLAAKLRTLLTRGAPFAANKFQAQMKQATLIADRATGPAFASPDQDFAFDVSVNACRSLSSGLGLRHPPPAANSVFAAAAALPQVRTCRTSMPLSHPLYQVSPLWQWRLCFVSFALCLALQ